MTFSPTELLEKCWGPGGPRKVSLTVMRWGIDAKDEHKEVDALLSIYSTVCLGLLSLLLLILFRRF